jgi:uncharacterized protein YdaU (DUF1376 family)
MHTYPWHVGDFGKDTGHLGEDETMVSVKVGLLRELAYRRLLDLYYSQEGPIPNKTHWVATRVRMLAHAPLVGSVLKEFFVLKDNFWHQKRADMEIAKYQKKADTNRKNGQKGGRKPNANPAGSHPVTTRTRTRTNKSPLPPGGAEAFESFWTEHPRKAGKPKALAAYAAALQRGAKPEDILAGMKRHLPAWLAKKAAGEGEYIPHLATWLNRDGWTDEVMQGADGGNWWESRLGIEKKGMEHALPAPPRGDSAEDIRAWYEHVAAVWLVAGDGPWIDTDSRAYQPYVRLRNGGA